MQEADPLGEIMTERPNRSTQYEYLFHETTCSDEFLAAFSNTDSIGNILNPFNYNEDVLNLQEEIRQEFWKLAKKVCTKKQFMILSYVKEGKTQQEIADILNVNQSSITKSIHGNRTYYEQDQKSYGGTIKKLKKCIDESEVFQELFRKIAELEEEKF